MGTMEYGHHVPECSLLTSLFEFVRSFMTETKGKLASGLDDQILVHEMRVEFEGVHPRFLGTQV